MPKRIINNITMDTKKYSNKWSSAQSLLTVVPNWCNQTNNINN